MRRADRVEIVSIQVLRALAAIGVVLDHAANDLQRFDVAPTALKGFTLGSAGVDLFFVISGFIMVFASEPLFGSRGGSLAFVNHRLIRIVPLYWLVTTFYVALVFLIPRLGGTSYQPSTIAASFLFFPVERPDGAIAPVVGQGWTLNYEIFFYAVFAIAVVAPRRKGVILASSVLIGAVTIGHFAKSLPPPGLFWTDSIVLEFVIGMIIGLAYREGMRLNLVASISLIATGIALLAISGLWQGEPRLVIWGGPAGFIVAGATLGGFSLQSPVWRVLAVVGDASYALYLTHTYPLRAVLPLAKHGLWIYVPAALLLPALVAICIHYAIERPMTQSLRRTSSRWISRASRHEEVHEQHRQFIQPKTA